jgi:hypothetical protein
MLTDTQKSKEGTFLAEYYLALLGTLLRTFRKIVWASLSEVLSPRALPFNVPTLYPFVLLVRAKRRLKYVRSIGGMILTGESRRFRRKYCYSEILYITHLTWTLSGTSPGFRSEPIIP